MVKELFPQGSVIAEVGVYRGGFSRQIYDNCFPSKLYCIDAWEQYPDYEKDSLCHTNQDDNWQATKNEMADGITAGRVEVIRGRSDAVAAAWTTPMDALFLDSIHVYKYVISDLRAWSKHIKPGGVIGCHDFTERPAALAMDFGVVKAVNEFCAEAGWEIIATTDEGDWPSCAIKRK